MNVLLISPKYPPSQGGVETQMGLLGIELVKDGYDVTVITSTESSHITTEVSCGIKIYRFPLPKTPLDYLNGYLFIKRNRDRIKTILEYGEIDVIHTHQFEMSVSFAHQLKKITNLPIITTVHTALSIDTDYNKFRPNLSEPLRWLMRIFPIKHFERLSIQKSDELLTNSEEIKKFCMEVCNKRATTLYPAINLQQFRPKKIKQIDPLGKYRILCSGRISPEKGQEVLVKSLKYVRETIDAEVSFMGAGTKRNIDALIKTIHDNGLEDYIQIMPPVGYAIVQDYYRDADLIVVPSFSESFGLVALENMALGNVVIASNVGGLSKLIEHKKTGLLFEPGDEKGLADMIRLAHTDPDLRANISENARKKAYDYEIYWNAKTIETKYKELVGERV